MNKLGKKDYIISLGTILLTVILYTCLFVLGKSSTAFTLSFVFVVLSELLFFACIYFIEESRIKPLANFISGLYMIISGSISVLAYDHFNSKFVLFLILEIVFFAAAFGVCGVIIYKSNVEKIKSRLEKEKGKKEITEVKKEKSSVNDLCEKILYDYMIDENTSIHKDKINGIYEEVSSDNFKNIDLKTREEILSLIKELDTLLRHQDDKALEVIKTIQEKF